MKNFIVERFRESESVRAAIIADSILLESIELVTEKLWSIISKGGSIYFCGNGGSAADAQHLATELSGRFLLDRQAIKAEALGTNIAFTTAVGNDFSFDDIFSRSIEALGRSGDALVCISTSGSSTNVINAAKKAKIMGISTIALTGSNKNVLGPLCDFHLSIPSVSVPRIQESYMLIGHIICEELEIRLVNNKEQL